MLIESTFRATVQRLAELAAPGNPAHVAVQAACRLVDILSPLNPRHADIMRLLNQPEHTDDDDESTEEEDDPL